MVVEMLEVSVTTGFLVLIGKAEETLAKRDMTPALHLFIFVLFVCFSLICVNLY